MLKMLLLSVSEVYRCSQMMFTSLDRYLTAGTRTVKDSVLQGQDR